jgi:tetratricopeptide (TPR) repeat protein
MARTLRFSGDPQAAELVLKEALSVADRVPAWGARFHRALAWLHQTRGERAESMGRIRAALRLSLIAGDRDGLCETYSDLGQLLVTFGAPEQAVDELQEGLLMVTGGDGSRIDAPPAGFWRLLLQLAEAELATGSPQHALDTGAAALRHASGIPIGEARCRSHLARSHRALGQVAQAEQDATAAFEAFRRLGDRLSAAECLLDHAAGQPERYRERLPLALAFARQLGWPEGIVTAERLLARAGTA